jgi:hypothetical protein
LLYVKEDKNFNRRYTLSISRINPPKFGGGLKFESDEKIGQKGTFYKGLGKRDAVEAVLPLPHHLSGGAQSLPVKRY